MFFCHVLAMHGRLWVQEKFSTHIWWEMIWWKFRENRTLGSVKTKLPALTLTNWVKVPSPFTQPKLPNQTYQIKSLKPNLPNLTYQTTLTKSNLGKLIFESLIELEQSREQKNLTPWSVVPLANFILVVIIFYPDPAALLLDVTQLFLFAQTRPSWGARR